MAFDPAVDSAVGTVVAQADGTILIAGPFYSVDGEARTNVARLEADGDLSRLRRPAAHSRVLQPLGGGAGRPGRWPDPDRRLVLRCGRRPAAGRGPPEHRRHPRPDFADVQANSVEALALEADGDVLFGGTFDSVGGGIAGDRPGRRRRHARRHLRRPPDLGVELRQGVGGPGRREGRGRGLVVEPQGTPRTLARLNTDGTPDTAFPDANFDGGVFDIEVGDDGILIGGAFGNVDYRARHGIARVLRARPRSRARPTPPSAVTVGPRSTRRE